MLELRTGEPRWYPLAVAGFVLALVAAVTLNRIQYEYALLLLLSAIFIVAMDCLVRYRRKAFIRLRVDRDFTLTISNESGDEFAAHKTGACWVSSRMIIIPLRIGAETRINAVISRGHNDPDSFRRFAIICRFGFAVDDSERHNVAQLNPQGSMK